VDKCLFTVKNSEKRKIRIIFSSKREKRLSQKVNYNMCQKTSADTAGGGALSMYHAGQTFGLQGVASARGEDETNVFLRKPRTYH
jgi:hypothetical protein